MDNTTHREEMIPSLSSKQKYGNKNYHFQQEFNNLNDTFEYIHKHDEFVLKMKWTLPAGLKNAYKKDRKIGKV